MSLTLSAVGLCVLIVAWTVWLKKAFRQALPRNLLGFAVSMFRSGEMEGSPYLLKFFRGHW